MSLADTVESVRKECLQYSKSQLDARYRRWQRINITLYFVIPLVLVMLGFALVLWAPHILGPQAAGLAGGIAMVFGPVGATFSVWAGFNYDEGEDCRPIPGLLNPENDYFAQFLRWQGVAEIREALLASGRDLYWSDFQPLQRVAYVEAWHNHRERKLADAKNSPDGPSED